MASYFNITLDTTAPSGVGVKINGDEARTTSRNVTLNIACTDADKTGYKMKIWGDITTGDETGNLIAAETDAAWEDFAASKTVLLIGDDDNSSSQRTVYVKVRDDLRNESATVSDSIILYSELPEITVISGPSPAKITTRADKTAGNNFSEQLSLAVLTRSTVAFTANKDISDVKVMITSSINSLHNDTTNILIPSTSGSMIGISSDSEEAENGYLNLSGASGMTVSGQNIAAGTEITLTICGDDLKSVSPDDGVKLIKIFVREKDAHWNV